MSAMDKESVTIFDAKTHLSALLDKVQKGREVIITKRGMPIAKLSPLEKEISPKTCKDVIDCMYEFRKKHTLGRDLTIETLKTEGRK